MKVILFFLCIALSTSAISKDIVLVNPSVPGVAFWDRVTDISLAAARDLNLTVEVVYGEDNRITHFEKLTNIASREVKPDLVIFMPYAGNAKFSYDLFENAKIPFITMEKTLENQEALTLGKPGKPYRLWYGEVFHNNEDAGKKLADSIIKQGQSVFSKKKLSLAALTGSFSGESSHRNDGLLASIARHPDVKLLQIVPANWSRERGLEASGKPAKFSQQVDWSGNIVISKGNEIHYATDESKLEIIGDGYLSRMQNSISADYILYMIQDGTFTAEKKDQGRVTMTLKPQAAKAK